MQVDEPWTAYHDFVSRGMFYAQSWALMHYLVLGNATVPHRAASVGFAEGMASLAQIGMFVMLGLLVSPERLAGALGPALVIGLVLLLVARPISVLVCLLPFRVPWRQKAFISWAGLRGAVPIVLGTFPLAARIDDAAFVFDTVFVLTKGGPGLATETIGLYTYRTGLSYFDMGYAMALSTFILGTVVVIAIVYLRLLRRRRGDLA